MSISSFTEDRTGPDDSFAALSAACAARFANQRGEPQVSIVVPVYGNWDVTERCLEAVTLCDPDVAAELIVIDDASPDETPRALARLSGVNVVRNAENVGFVRGCNRGAAIARGPYLFFLNNDTELYPGAIAALLRRIESDERIGIVGSKLIYPDGTLQEAGGIIWSDGFAWNYGRLDDVALAEYNFTRDVDYVSGAALMIRADLFRAIGGFDERYAPAYYEDADLCFAARQRGMRVVYEPSSAVTHLEGLTAGHDTSTGAKRFYEINRPKFASKWYDVLRHSHYPYAEWNVRRAARGRGERKAAVLVVTDRVPGAGAQDRPGAAAGLVHGLLAAGHRVVVLPDDLASAQPETRALQDAGVEVLVRTSADARDAREHLVQALPTVGLVVLDGAAQCRRYLPAVRAASGIPVLYAQSAGALDPVCVDAADGTVTANAAGADALRGEGRGPAAAWSAFSTVVDLIDRLAPPRGT